MSNIQPIASGESGLSSRNKINESFIEANKVESMGDTLELHTLQIAALGGETSDLAANKIYTESDEIGLKNALIDPDNSNISILLEKEITLSGAVDIKPENVTIYGRNLVLADGVEFQGDASNLNRVIRFENKVAFNGDNTVNYNSSDTAINLSFKSIISTNKGIVRDVSFNQSSTSAFAVDYSDVNNVKIATSGGAFEVRNNDIGLHKTTWRVTENDISITGELSGNCFKVVCDMVVDGSTDTPKIASLFPTLTGGFVSFQRYEGVLTSTRTGSVNSTSVSINNFFSDSSPLSQMSFGTDPGEGYEKEVVSDDTGTYFENTEKKGIASATTITLQLNTANTETGLNVEVTLTGTITGY